MVGFKYSDNTLIDSTDLGAYEIQLHKGVIIFSKAGELELVLSAVGHQRLFVALLLKNSSVIKTSAMFKDPSAALEEVVKHAFYG